jgi:hypothetical protein
MSNRTRLIRKLLLCATGLFVIAGIAAPFINAARFKQQIREGLERGLHRKVDIVGKVNFLLFTGPGFTVEDVLIAEDSRSGIEPFAHVASLSARLRLRSLWTGKLEFSNLRLDEPSVNLVKAPDGPWNIQPLLQQTVGAAGAAAPEWPLPDIQVRGGRLNFKFGDTKSVFYLANADVDIAPLNARGGAFSVRFEGEPARTDRAAQVFGRISGRGSWNPHESGEGEVNLSVRWEKSPIAEFVVLWTGQDAGVHGLITADARLSGPLSKLQISGNTQIEDIHRWDLMPSKAGGWPLAFRGKLNVHDEELELETVPAQDRQLDGRLRALRVLSKPEWGVLLTAKKLSIAPLLEIARHFGTQVPAQLTLDGDVTGVVGYSREFGMQGRLLASGATAQLPGVEPLRCEQAAIIVDHDHLQLDSANIAVDRSQSVLVEADFAGAGNKLDVRLSTRNTTAARLLSSADAPLFDTLKDGRWRGTLHYRREDTEAGVWTGLFDLQDTTVSIPGLAEPVVLSSASVKMNGQKISVEKMRGKTSKLPFQGEYRYEPDSPRPHRFAVNLDEAGLARIEEILMPTLRRRQGFLARTLRFAAPPSPDWLKNRRAEGSLHFGTLTLSNLEFQNVRTRVIWDGVNVDLPEITANVEEGALKGSMKLDLSRNVPTYKMKATMEGADWLNGKLDGDVKMTTSGTGTETMANAVADGCFSSHAVTLAAELEFKTFSGCYEFAPAKSARLQITKIQASSGQDTYSGRGGTLADGRMVLDLTGKKALRLTGTLAPWQFELAH